jgi:hypothetical protein
VTVEIKCKSAAPYPLYEYSSINTGEGSNFHQRELKNNEIYIRPWIVKNLRLEAFSYLFVKHLVDSYIDEKSSIENFYAFHQYFLVQLGGGELDLYTGKLYIKQKFGVCAL